ncbi:MAG: hypothetical protein HYY24_29410 [Verrucomicrobia bacterium]|nr:hypothetical protein [Verrucomicrobiota bacterium]
MKIVLYRRPLLTRPLPQRAAWLRALKLGLPVGLVQAAIHQGDHWLSRSLDAAVLLKSLASLGIAFTLVLFSSPETQVQRTPKQQL